MTSKNVVIYLLLICLLGALLVKGCGSSSSCSCLSPIPGGEPPDMGFKADKKIPNAVQARISSHTFTFLTSRIKDILALLLKEQTGGTGSLTFEIPYSESDNGNGCKTYICVNRNCSVTVTPNSAQLDLVAPDTINFKINTNIKSNDIRVKYDRHVVFGCANLFNCDVSIDIKNRDVSGQIKLFDDPFTNFMTFDLPADKLSVEIKADDIKIKGNIGCDIANWNLIKSIALSFFDIKKMIAEEIPPVIAEQTCQPCGKQNDPPCPKGSTCQKYKDGNYCVAASTNKCVAKPLGAIGRLDLSEFLKDFAPGLKASLDLYAVAGDFPPYPPKVRDKGIDIQVIGGTDAERNMCVPETEPPKLDGGAIPLLSLGNSAAICQSCDPNNPICPSDSTCSGKYGICMKDETNGVCPDIPFMVGIGINEYFLRKFFWDAFNSGVLCLNIDSATVPQLTSGVLSMLLPSLKELTDGKNTSVIISMRPTKAPDIKIGRGLLRLSGDKKEIFRPLILLSISQLSIDFYAVVYDRYTRIFTLTADLEIPIALDVVEREKTDPNDPNKSIRVVELVPVLGDLTNAIRNIVVSNSELLAEKPEDIARQLSSLIGTLVGPLLGGAGLSGFELPDLQGFVLKIRSIAGSVAYDAINDPSCNDFNESAPACYYKFMNIFADIDLALQSSPVPLYTPSISVKSVERGKIVFTNADRDYEYSFRVNNGLWSFFMSGEEIVVETLDTSFEARHKVEIRYRKKGTETYKTISHPIFVLADYTPPEIRLERDENKVFIDVMDIVSSRESILVEYSYDGYNFVKAATNEIVLKPGVEFIVVRAQDEAKNSSAVKVEIKELRQAHMNRVSTSIKDGEVETHFGCSCNLLE
ncbi:MAG: hypothetical protein N2746_03780 [Deltaproteobacteria bacterium]|nr:hypothetical protein [Deltaproteobacteria bacterium]